jgi:hypothetical protein
MIYYVTRPSLHQNWEWKGSISRQDEEEDQSGGVDVNEITPTDFVKKHSEK